MVSLIKRVVRWVIRRYGVRLYGLWCRTTQDVTNAAFSHMVTHLGSQCRVHHPFYLMNPQYLSIGSNFWAGPGLRIEAWDEYAGQKHTPCITIGDNVIFNYDVHIGVIAELSIADNVMIGSRVLITDHSHGAMTSEELKTPARMRPLSQKGPVVIEENVWIGEGACILPGVRVGRNAVIGANAVVTREVAPNTVVGGIPARLLRTIHDDNSTSWQGGE